MESNLKEVDFELVPCTCACHNPENRDENGVPTIRHIVPCCYNGMKIVPKQITNEKKKDENY